MKMKSLMKKREKKNIDITMNTVIAPYYVGLGIRDNEDNRSFYV